MSGWRFKVGDKITLNDRAKEPVYLRAREIAKAIGLVVPDHGIVYTVRECVRLDSYIADQACGYRLAEIVNPSLWRCGPVWSHEIAFDDCLWSPVVSQTMQDLLALQNPANHKNLQPIEPLVPKPVRRPGFLPRPWSIPDDLPLPAKPEKVA